MFFKKKTLPEVETSVKTNESEEPKQTVNDSIDRSIENDSLKVKKDSVHQEEIIKAMAKEVSKDKKTPENSDKTETTPANPDKKDKKSDDKQEENKEQEKNQDL